MGIKVSMQPSDMASESNPADCIVHYGNTAPDGSLNIYDSGFMHETDIHPMEPEVVRLDGSAILFPAPEGFGLRFDLFSALFYMLSRYEEYLSFDPDVHGRFEAEKSLACKHGFVEEPVVDQWLIMFAKVLIAKYPRLVIPEWKFRFISTFDVDNPWAYKYRGVFRNMAGIAKKMLRFQISEAWHQLSVFRGTIPDPFDTYAYIYKVEKEFGFRSHFFFLFGNYGKQDKNYAQNSFQFRNLLNELKTGRTIGIHPSYRSNCSLPLLESECRKYQRLLGVHPVHSRQHYLIVRFPGTYHRLISMGIRNDYSMGYASTVGFRAGTTLPFKFYDLSLEKETDLMIHPFAVMDVTLNQYMGLGEKDALLRIVKLIHKIKDVNGIFTSLWHNESLCEQGNWKGWRSVFEGMAEEATTIK
jgi:hypothetical protein